jgi:hypothetical protein
MKRTLMYVLSSLILSSMVVIGLSGCGSSSSGTKSPLNPAGTYNVTYNPASVVLNCTATNSNTGATSSTSTTIFLGGTITITTVTNGANTGYIWTETQWMSGALFVGSSSKSNLSCDSNSCTGTVDYTVNFQVPDSQGGYMSSSMPVAVNNITISNNNLNGTETIGNMNLTDSTDPYFSGSCTWSPNTISFSGTKQ